MATTLIDEAGLRARGINYSSSQLYRKAKAGTFPMPIKVGDRRKAWVAAEIDAYVEGLISARDETRTGV